MVARTPLMAAAITGSDVNRFWEKVSKADYPKGCWEWTASGRGVGYGCMKVGGRVFDSHRLSWLIHFGDIPASQLVCHECDNRLCVRPDHLFLGASIDNVRDMIAKGRKPISFGRECWNAKLSNDDVVMIRLLVDRYGISHRRLAAMFGVCFNTIGGIARREQWRHVPEFACLNFPQEQPQ